MDRPTRLLQTLVSSAKKIKVLLFLLPLLGIILFLHQKNTQLQTLSEEIALLEKKRSCFQKKDPQKTETLSLLVPELARVTALAHHYPDHPMLQERLAFLQSGSNRIRWAQSKLQNPVQMNDDDLRKFLELMDGVSIKEFDLRKQKEKGDENVYLINVELK
jgi:hypothetical protein